MTALAIVAMWLLVGSIVLGVCSRWISKIEDSEAPQLDLPFVLFMVFAFPLLILITIIIVCFDYKVGTKVMAGLRFVGKLVQEVMEWVWFVRIN